jgi:predicted phosphodiesterase
MTPQRQIALDLLGRFPKAKTKTLAHMAYDKNRAVFNTVESARSMIRKLRGASGHKARASCTVKDHFRAPQSPGDPFKRIPRGETHFENGWGAVQIEGPARVLVLSDIHIPYHDKKAVLTALREGKAQRCNVILLNGDIADCFSVSRWEKDPRKRNFAREIKTVKAFLSALREVFPRARIIYKLGNHEERFQSYMSLKAPELLGVADFEFENIYGLGELGIELVGENRPVRLGDLNVIHGHEYKFAISNPVNAARGLFLRAKSYALCGHFHQSSYHTEKTLEQRIVATWSTGCLCDMHPDYSPLNNWAHGFAIVTINRAGKFEVQNRCIRGGKIY